MCKKRERFTLDIEKKVEKFSIYVAKVTKLLRNIQLKKIKGACLRHQLFPREIRAKLTFSFSQVD